MHLHYILQSLVVENSVDLYPRLGPTMEWDIAAAQVIVEEAGKTIMTENGTMKYNKKQLVNESFIVS